MKGRIYLVSILSSAFSTKKEISSLVGVEMEACADWLPLKVWISLAAIASILIEWDVLKVHVAIGLKLVTFKHLQGCFPYAIVMRCCTSVASILTLFTFVCARLRTTVRARARRWRS